MEYQSALETLEDRLSGRTPKEQFDALAGAERLWWRHCQDGIRHRTDWPASRQLLAEISDQASSEDARRAFMAGAQAIASVAQALTCHAYGGDRGQRMPSAATAEDLWPVLEPAVGHWGSSGLLVPMAPGAGLLPGKGLDAVSADVRERVQTVVRAADDHPGGPARAMVVLTALQLAGARFPQGRTIRVPVLFDRPGTAGGASGVLEIFEFPEGPAGLFPDPRSMYFARADKEFTRALAQAWTWATRGQPGNRCVLWRVILDHDAPVPSIEGGSLGAPFAIALQELLKYVMVRRPSWAWVRGVFRGPRPRCAITGAISGAETLAAVGGMPAKLDAARARRWRLVAPQANQPASVHVPVDVRVYWAATLGEASRFSRRWRPVRASLAAVVAFALVGAGIPIYLASAARQQVNTQHSFAVSAQLAIQSEALDASDPATAALLAAAAWRIAPSSQARESMLDAFAQPTRGTLRTYAQNSDLGLTSVAFSPDGRLLATGNGDHTVVLWDMTTHRPITPPMQANYLKTQGGFGGINGLAFSPNGNLLATGAGDGAARLWNVATHRQIGRALRIGGLAGVNAVAFSPDGKLLATATSDGRVVLWNVATHRQILPSMKASGKPDDGSDTNVIDHGGVKAVAFSPDGKIIATAGDDGSVLLWSVATHQQIGEPMIVGTPGFAVAPRGVGGLAFSPDGKLLATAGHDGTARLWDVATHRQIGQSMHAEGSPKGLTAVAFSHDGKVLATAGDDGTARLWDVTTHQQTGPPIDATDAGGVTGVAFSPDGKLLATVGRDDTARLWDFNIYRQVGPLIQTVGLTAQQVMFSPGGKLLATADDNGTVQLWNVATHRQILPAMKASGSGGPGASGLAFSPNGELLATGEGVIQLWNVATHYQIFPDMLGAASGVKGVAFSPDGKLLATVGADNVARLWDVATHDQIGRPMLASHGRGANGVTFSPDGKLLATVGADDMARLWDVATHDQIGKSMLASDTSGVNAVAFSPDGKLLATGGGDGTARLWDVATARQAGVPLTGAPTRSSSDEPAFQVADVAFSPDGKLLATSGNDGTVRLWDVAALQQTGPPIDVTGGGVNGVAFSPDGKLLATADADGTVALWNVMFPRNLPKAMCSIAAGSTLTTQQWSAYVGSEPFQKVCP